MDSLVEENIQELLKNLGIFYKLDEEARGNTPKRFEKALLELTRGFFAKPEELFKEFEAPHNDLVVVKKLPFYSLCEHHFLPFFGTVSIAYVPNGKVLGLSKFPRLVQIYSKRVQVQERMTAQIADIIMKNLKPKGVMVESVGRHMCMEMRGIESTGETVTSVVRGIFKTKPTLRMEALEKFK